MNVIKDRYGSYRGYGRHVQTYLAGYLGAYKNARRVGWERVERLVFVCKGNVCRSPYAEMRAKALSVPAISRGLETSGDTPANPAALRIANERGLDLSGHRSAKYRASDLAPTDLVLTFDPEHFNAIRGSTAPPGSQVSLIGIWGPHPSPLIPDPYGKSDAYFRTCFATIDLRLREILTCLEMPPKAPEPSQGADNNVA
jgi:protein-tyrosine phosphatase